MTDQPTPLESDPMLQAEEAAAREAAATVTEAGIDETTATSVSVVQGGIGRLRAEDVAVSRGAVGLAQADRVSVELGALGGAYAQQVRVTQGVANGVVARDAVVGQSLVRTMIAGSVRADRPTGVLFLFAARVDGDVRPVFGWRAAIAFGAAFGLVSGLIRLVRSRD
jgi:hypothetical protein